MKVDVDDLTGSTTREVIDLNDRPVKGKGMTPSLTVLDGKKKLLLHTRSLQINSYEK